MDHISIFNKAILLGYNADGKCIYSQICELDEYYDGEHPWDDGEMIQEIRLERVCGLLFDQAGELIQDFETIFDPNSGKFVRGKVKFSDGTVQEG